MRRMPSSSLMSARPGIRLMSTTYSGMANCSFISGIRLWPPASTTASGPCSSSREIASSSVSGAQYSNRDGIMWPSLFRARACNVPLAGAKVNPAGRPRSPTSVVAAKGPSRNSHAGQFLHLAVANSIRSPRVAPLPQRRVSRGVRALPTRCSSPIPLRTPFRLPWAPRYTPPKAAGHSGRTGLGGRQGGIPASRGNDGCAKVSEGGNPSRAGCVSVTPEAVRYLLLQISR